MVSYDPAVAARLHAIRLEVDELAARPDVGEAEVRRMAELFDESVAITGLDREIRSRQFASGLHARGIAVDMPPRSRWWPNSGTHLH